MRTSIKYFFFLTLLVTFSSCNETAELEKGMVSFDQAFIPVFYYSYINDLDSAERAMLVLDRKWDNLYTEFEEHAPYAHNWKASFQMVDAWLDEADCAIKSREANLALIQLDHARYELMDLRWREGMTYYLDKVWDLEAAIDLVVQTSSDEMLDLLEWQEFVPMVYDVEEAWSEMKDKTWKDGRFEFTEDEKIAESVLKEQLGINVDHFIRMVEKAERCEVEDAAKDMEVAYLNYIYFFGDFDATKTFYVAN